MKTKKGQLLLKTEELLLPVDLVHWSLIVLNLAELIELLSISNLRLGLGRLVELGLVES